MIYNLFKLKYLIKKNKDLTSIDSYWFNYYSIIEDNDEFKIFSKLNPNFKFLFSVFYEYSINEFYNSFLVFKKNQNNNRMIDNLLNESLKMVFDYKKPLMLQEIYSYFNKDEFDGNF